MAINQISTANTFQQWLIATQSLIAFANSITDGPSGGTFTANTSQFVITGNLTVGNTVTCAITNTDVIIFDDGTRLSSNVSIVNAYNKANAAYDYANTLNISITTANITVTSNVTTSNITVSNTITTANITVTSNVTTSNITVSNNVTVTKNVAANNITANLISATDFNTTSDIVLKDNMQQITNSLDVLEKITGFTFNWKSDGKISYGVSAQEVETILPDVVRIRDDGYKGVNYLNLIAFLIEAIKDLKKEVIEIKKHYK